MINLSDQCNMKSIKVKRNCDKSYEYNFKLKDATQRDKNERKEKLCKINVVPDTFQFND